MCDGVNLQIVYPQHYDYKKEVSWEQKTEAKHRDMLVNRRVLSYINTSFSFDVLKNLELFNYF